MEYDIKLTAEDLSVVQLSLAERPLKEVYNTFAKIVHQVMTQDIQRVQANEQSETQGTADH
jgi:hypothetical protein